MSPAPEIEVLLVDDEPLVRAGLSMLVDAESGLTVVGEADDGLMAVRLAAELRPDVVVMDLRMPELDGVQATRRLAGDGSPSRRGEVPRVLVLTTYDDDAAVYGALRAGASGFLLKSAAPRCLGDAIRSVAAGHAWLDPVVTRRLLDDFVARPDDRCLDPAQLAPLTAREREVLTLVGRGLTNDAIAAHLVISRETVRTHVGRVLTKLGLHDRAQAVSIAYRTGLVRAHDPPRASAVPLAT